MRTLNLLFAAVLFPGCLTDTELTRAEAKEAMEASVSSARGEAATTEVIEISTSFTLGQAAEDAAEQLRAWWAAASPCATVTRDGSTVTADFGDLADDCTYNGHTYGGLASVTVDRTDQDDVAVTWAFDSLTNGDVTVDGGADVTWAGGENPSRHVVHDLVWDRDGETLAATGDRIQTLLDPDAGISEGILINGTRDWSADAGDWALDIADIEARPVDPVPQAGVYTMTTPAGKTATLTFESLDDDTIAVTLSGVRGGDRVYEVSSTGAVTETSAD